MVLELLVELLLRGRAPPCLRGLLSVHVFLG